MKPGDVIKVRLGGDVHEAEVVKENPKTVLVKVLWSKTKHRKVKPKLTEMGQMSLFGSNGFKSVKVPYIARGTKIIKIPKVKIVLEKQIKVTEHRLDGEPELPPTPAPQETVVEEVLVPDTLEKVVEGVREVFTEHGKTMEVGVVELEPKPDPFAELEAAIKKRGGN